MDRNPYREPQNSDDFQTEPVTETPEHVQDTYESAGVPTPEEIARIRAEEDRQAEAEFNDQHGEAARPASQVGSQASAALREAWKQVESVGQTIGAALQGRGNVVMVRVNDEALKHLDMLVEAEITKSRSESAALLISEGIKANQQMFDRIGEITTKISALREELRESVRSHRPTEE